VEEVLRIHSEKHHDRIKHESTWPKGGDCGDGMSPFGKVCAIFSVFSV
jgi:hypothetical protein